jgi:hypothetical protein
MVILYRSADSKLNSAAEIHYFQTHELVGFPFFGIQIFDYDPLSAGALSNMATWSVLNIQDKIKAFIGA